MAAPSSVEPVLARSTLAREPSWSPPLPCRHRATIVVFCKSHSGSRLIVRLLEAAGVFMGANQNTSGDSWDLLPVIRSLVTRHSPDYAGVLRGEDGLLEDMVEAALCRHLAGYVLLG